MKKRRNLALVRRSPSGHLVKVERLCSSEDRVPIKNERLNPTQLVGFFISLTAST